MQLSATSLLVSSVIIRAMENNAAAVYVGDSTVSSSNSGKLLARDSITFSGDRNCGLIDLANVYLDCDTGNTDGVDIWYIDATEEHAVFFELIEQNSEVQP